MITLVNLSQTLLNKLLVNFTQTLFKQACTQFWLYCRKGKIEMWDQTL